MLGKEGDEVTGGTTGADLGAGEGAPVGLLGVGEDQEHGQGVPQRQPGEDGIHPRRRRGQRIDIGLQGLPALFLGKAHGAGGSGAVGTRVTGPRVSATAPQDNPTPKPQATTRSGRRPSSGPRASTKAHGIEAELWLPKRSTRSVSYTHLTLPTSLRLWIIVVPWTPCKQMKHPTGI